MSGRMLLLIGAMLLGGCGDEPGMLRNDMATQPKYDTYQPSDLFADGTSARPLVPGTVPRPPETVPGQPYAAGYAAELVPAAQAIPLPVTRRTIERGQELFNVFCAVCHGRLGNGNGMIVQRGFSPPPSFHIPRLREASDGHFYRVISEGYGAMYSYADRVRPEQRWQIVAYIRALQAAPLLAGPGLDARQRAILEGHTPTTAPAGAQP